MAAFYFCIKSCILILIRVNKERDYEIKKNFTRIWGNY